MGRRSHMRKTHKIRVSLTDQAYRDLHVYCAQHDIPISRLVDAFLQELARREMPTQRELLDQPPKSPSSNKKWRSKSAAILPATRMESVIYGRRDTIMTPTPPRDFRHKLLIKDL
jgi:hypothetical protein